MNIKFLDCTLRDGGYYNNWDFDEIIVNAYLQAMAYSCVDYVELGMRRFHSEKCLGASAFTTKNYLERINLPPGPVYGVMIDAKTILTSGLSQKLAVKKLFDYSKNEKINFVRVAAHSHELNKIEVMLGTLKELGYSIGLNIMQSSKIDSYELTNIAKVFEKLNIIDVLYFADSLGSMDPKDVKRIYKALSLGWHSEIGFHAHNNMGQACENINCAIELGCTWIDGTVSGMGRGAGNAESEYLILNPALKKEQSDPSKLIELALKHFKPMKVLYGWGVSIEYMLGAKLNLHPMYIQELCSDNNIEASLRYKIISDLGNLENPSQFNPDNLQAVKSSLSDSIELTYGDIIPGFLTDREVLIIAQTDTIFRYEADIIDYIKVKKPFVISINHPAKKSNIQYDMIAVTHNEKYRKELESYISEKYSYVAPAKLFESLGKKFRNNIIYNFGIDVKAETFKIFPNYCIIPYHMTIAYAIAFVKQANASRINLVGFDGHKDDNIQQKNMQGFFQIIARENIKVNSLTPTKYSLPERSLHDFYL